MQHKELCREVEQQLQFKPKVRTDFDYLSEKILAKTHETVSANTLMRLWGYRESVNARRSTLDILARFVGSEDYAHFLKERGLADDVEADEADEAEEVTEEVQEQTSPLTSPTPGTPKASEPDEMPNPATPPSKPNINIKRLVMACLILAIVAGAGFALWRYTKQTPLEEGLPRGAKDMTHLLGNPHCDTDKLDAWTYEHGGVTLSEDSTLMYYMKDFDVYQVIHGLPAGEYELRAKAWQLPTERETARYDYEHAVDKEDGCALTNAEIYAGPFAHRVKNYVSAQHIEGTDSSDVRLRFVCLDDSVRIGFRSYGNFRRFSLAVADDFRLFLIREAKSEAEIQELAALRDSAQVADSTRPLLKDGQFADWWKGHEDALPEGWLTDQDPNCCRLVHKRDVGRGFGDSDIYVEYLSQKPAKHGLILGKKAVLGPGTYLIGGCVFARDEKNLFTNVVFAVKGFVNGFKTSPMMDYHAVRIELTEPQELTFGLWAAEGSNVCRAGIALLEVLDDYDFENNPRGLTYVEN